MSNVIYHPSPFQHLNYGLVLGEAMYKKTLKDLNQGKQIRHHLLEHDVTEQAHTVLLPCKQGTPVVLVVLWEKLLAKADSVGLTGVLVHECVHVSQHIMEAMHEDTPSHEFQAYSIERIYTDLYTDYCQHMRVKEIW